MRAEIIWESIQQYRQPVFLQRQLWQTADEELEQRVGVALGEESMEEDVNVLLGPGLNIKRNPSLWT